MTKKSFLFNCSTINLPSVQKAVEWISQGNQSQQTTATANTASAPQTMAQVTKPKQHTTRNSQKTATATQVIQLSISSIATDVKVVISPKDTVEVEKPKRQTAHRGKSLEGASLLM